MIDARDILRLTDALQRIDPLPDTTISHRIFDDGKKLTAIRNGSDLTTSRYRVAVEWFDRNWPADALWPTDIVRPSRARVAA